MASNYNAQPFPAEVLVEDGRPRLARRRQSIDALLADDLT
jgi:diaminopimelate decarboxylase